MGTPGEAWRKLPPDFVDEVEMPFEIRCDYCGSDHKLMVKVDKRPDGILGSVDTVEGSCIVINSFNN